MVAAKPVGKTITENEPEANPDAQVPDAPKSGIESGKLVRYIGPADVREISRSAWDNVGSQSGMTRWQKKNAFSVDAADLDDAALQYCADDPEFVIVDAPVVRND